jgi:hypothetical protein
LKWGFKFTKKVTNLLGAGGSEDEGAGLVGVFRALFTEYFVFD